MIHGINHVAISTPDLERAVRFYRDVLGFAEAERFAWRPGETVVDRVTELPRSSADAAVLHAGNLLIELFEFHAPAARPAPPDRRVSDHGICHIALEVTDIDGVHRRLSAAGMRFSCEPQTLWDGTRISYGRDPDRNVVELQQLPDAANAMWLPALHGNADRRG